MLDPLPAERLESELRRLYAVSYTGREPTEDEVYSLISVIRLTLVTRPSIQLSNPNDLDDWAETLMAKEVSVYDDLNGDPEVIGRLKGLAKQAVENIVSSN